VSHLPLVKTIQLGQVVVYQENSHLELTLLEHVKVNGCKFHTRGTWDIEPQQEVPSQAATKRCMTLNRIGGSLEEILEQCVP
jgi:hypothetical protein